MLSLTIKENGKRLNGMGSLSRQRSFQEGNTKEEQGESLKDTVVKIEKEIRDYEIKLDNGLEMTFDLKGNLIDIDD